MSLHRQAICSGVNLSMQPFTQKQILDAYNRAPDLIRTTFNGEPIRTFIAGLRTKYQLHIDTAGIVGEGIGYLLLGLMDPNTFRQHIKAAGLSDTTVATIITDINQQIFIPLRGKMREEGGGTRMPTPTPPAPTYAPPVPTAQGVVSPVAQSPRATPAVESAEELGMEVVPPSPPTPPAALRGKSPMPTPEGAASHFHLENRLPSRPTAAPLPPRGVLPRPAAPIFHKPLPLTPARSAGSGERPEGVLAAPPPAPKSPLHLEQPLAPRPMAAGAPPHNLPTGTPPAVPAPRIEHPPLPVPPPPLNAPLRGASDLPGAPSPKGELPVRPEVVAPLARPAPAPLSSAAAPAAPHTRYPVDPYREPIE